MIRKIPPLVASVTLIGSTGLTAYADNGSGTVHRVGENLKIEGEAATDVSEETTESESVNQEKSSKGLLYRIGAVIIAENCT